MTCVFFLISENLPSCPYNEHRTAHLMTKPWNPLNRSILAWQCDRHIPSCGLYPTTTTINVVVVHKDQDFTMVH